MPIHQNPSLQEAAKTLRQATRKKSLLVMKAECDVLYEGRAKTKLNSGERLVIKKADGAFLVHGPENYQPLNWQPETDEWRIENNEDNIRVEARRSNPDELLRLSINEVEFLNSFKLRSTSSQEVLGDEKDIQDAIENNPNLILEGAELVEREKKTPLGFADFLMRHEERLKVIEVKRNPDHNSLVQLDRYVEEIDEEHSEEVSGVLVAPEFSESLAEQAEQRGIETVTVSVSEAVEDYEILNDSQKGLDSF